MIRFKTLLQGPDGKIRPGQVTDKFSKKREAEFVDGGFAEYVTEEPTPEPEKPEPEQTVSKAEIETATAPPSRRRKKAAE